MRYAHIYYKVIGANKYIFITLNNVKLSKRFLLIHAASQWSRDLNGRCAYCLHAFGTWAISNIPLTSGNKSYH